MTLLVLTLLNMLVHRCPSQFCMYIETLSWWGQTSQRSLYSCFKLISYHQQGIRITYLAHHPARMIVNLGIVYELRTILAWVLGLLRMCVFLIELPTPTQLKYS